MFLGGADQPTLVEAAGCGADVMIQEMEDFTAPAQRPAARAISPDVLAAWKAAGVVAGVRVAMACTGCRTPVELRGGLFFKLKAEH